MKRGPSRLALEVVDAIEGERRHVAKQLHDHLCQTLVGVNFLLESAARGGDVQGHLAPEQAAFQEKLERLRELMRTAVTEAYQLNDHLAPLEHGEQSLQHRLEKLAAEARRKLPCELILDELCVQALPSREQTALLRIAQEAVQYALSRPDTEHLCIRLDQEDSRVKLDISDDGGEATEPELGGTGGRGKSKSTMHYYAESIGAKLSVKSTELGTSVVCVLAA